MVLVDRLDRLSRDSDHRGFLRTEAKYAGVQIASARETIDDSPVGRLIESAHDFKAMSERQKNVKNMARGKRTKAAQGRPIGQGKPSYGLAWTVATRRAAKHVGWQEDPATIAIVRRIFADYDAGKSLRQLAADLEADGILPPYHDRTGNRHWSVGTLRLILTERALHRRSRRLPHRLLQGAGRGHRQDEAASLASARSTSRCRCRQGTAPVVIDRALFDRVQIRLDGNQARAVDYRATRNPEIGILRRGLAFCGTVRQQADGHYRDPRRADVPLCRVASTWAVRSPSASPSTAPTPPYGTS